MLASFIELNNRVIDRFSAEERKNIGIHTCPGGDCDSTHSADVDYADLLPSMFKMNAGYFLIQLASEKDKERVYKLIGEHSRKDANGVPQVAFIGLSIRRTPAWRRPRKCAPISCWRPAGLAPPWGSPIISAVPACWQAAGPKRICPPSAARPRCCQAVAHRRPWRRSSACGPSIHP